MIAILCPECGSNTFETFSEGDDLVLVCQICGEEIRVKGVFAEYDKQQIYVLSCFKRSG